MEMTQEIYYRCGPVPKVLDFKFLATPAVLPFCGTISMACLYVLAWPEETVCAVWQVVGVL